MQRVISVSLNRNVYHLEEDAHARLAEYLDRAPRRLAAYPDRAEVLADVEQAIADQFTRQLQAGQSVITLAELSTALTDIGEVEIPGAPGPMPAGAAAGGDGAAPASGTALQQVSEGAWISGGLQRAREEQPARRDAAADPLRAAVAERRATAVAAGEITRDRHRDPQQARDADGLTTARRPVRPEASGSGSRGL